MPCRRVMPIAGYLSLNCFMVVRGATHEISSAILFIRFDTSKRATTMR